MSLHPHHGRSRLARWLALATVCALLLGAYWIGLQRVGALLGDSVEQALRPVPALDDHTPRVD